MASLTTKNNTPEKTLSPDLQTIPDSTTAAVSVSCWLFQLTLCNKTGGAVTVTIQDRATVPKTLLAAVSIAANTSYILEWQEGQFMKNGFTWSASAASSIDASVGGFYTEGS